MSLVPFFQHFTTCKRSICQFVQLPALTYIGEDRLQFAMQRDLYRRGCSYLPKSTSAEKLEDLILVGHGVKNFVLHQMIIPVALRIAAAAAVGRVGHLLAMRRHACLLAMLLLLLLLQLLLSMMLRYYSATHRIRVGGVDCQAVTITFPRPSFSL